MKDNLTLVVTILDRSGSMASVQEPTITGFNKFLSEQKELPGECLFSIYQFDNVYEPVCVMRSVKEVEPLTTKTYVPRNSTALLDAMGHTIDDVGKALAAMPEKKRPSKVIVITVTDGYENASNDFTYKQVAERIKHQQDNYKWEFVFLGANQDAIATASQLNIPIASSMTYTNTSKGLHNVYTSASASVSSSRATGQSVNFTDVQRSTNSPANKDNYDSSDSVPPSGVTK